MKQNMRFVRISKTHITIHAARIVARLWSLNARIPMQMYKKNSITPQKEIITLRIWDFESLSLPPIAITTKMIAMIKNGK